MNSDASKLIGFIAPKMDRSEELEFLDPDEELHEIVGMRLPCFPIICPGGIAVRTRRQMNIRIGKGIDTVEIPTMSERFWGRIKHPTTGIIEVERHNIPLSRAFYFLKELVEDYPGASIEILYMVEDAQRGNHSRGGWVRLSELFS